MRSGCGGGASSVEPLVYYLYTVASYFLPFFPFIQHHNIIILLRNITVTLSFMVYLDNTPPKKHWFCLPITNGVPKVTNEHLFIL